MEFLFIIKACLIVLLACVLFAFCIFLLFFLRTYSKIQKSDDDSNLKGD